MVWFTTRVVFGKKLCVGKSIVRGPSEKRPVVGIDLGVFGICRIGRWCGLSKKGQAINICYFIK